MLLIVMSLLLVILGDTLRVSFIDSIKQQC